MRIITRKTIRIVLILLPVLLMVYLFTASEVENPESGNTNGNRENLTDQTLEDEFEVFQEFEDFNEKTKYTDKNTGAEKDKTESTGNSSNDEAESSDEFLPMDSADEFEPMNIVEKDSNNKSEKDALFFLPRDRIIVLLISFVGVIISGLLVKSRFGRKLRFFFMVAGLIFFGFYLGGCPCPIMSFFKVFLVFRGDFQATTGVIWFLGLAYLTYFVGKTWCGWLCPLGALQEFLYKDGLYKNQKSNTIKKIFRTGRVILIISMIGFLLFTGIIILSQIDPFKPIFNLFYAPVSLITWILIVVLIISSILFYRPFCRTVCPLGLVLGLVSRIPGATRIRTGENCNSCTRCEKNCDMGAIDIITHDRAVFHEDCILCGDCMENCKQEAITLSTDKIQNKIQITKEISK